MESLILSFNAVTPLFILMLVGYAIRGAGLASKSDFDKMNSLVFKIFLPVLLFYNIYSTTNIETFDISIVLFTILGVVATFVVGYIILKATMKDFSKASSMLQGFYRSNFAILGIPLINSICGENVTGLTYLMVAVVVPLFSILAVIGFEVFKAQKSDIKILSLIVEMIKTPLIIGCLLGLVFFLFNIKLPFVIEKSVSDISKIATPLAIVAIGGSFTFRSIKGCLKEVAITVFLRLVFIPLITIIIAVMMGFRGEALACLLITFGGPVSISSFSMAQQMGGDEDVAANVVIFSSLLCILTMFCWIFALNMLGLF